MADNKFDLTTHHRDKKTGRIKRVTPYKLIIKEGNRIYERDGIQYYEDGSPVVKEVQEVASRAALDEKVEQLSSKPDNKSRAKKKELADGSGPT